MTKKDFRAFISPKVKAAHFYANNYIQGVKPNPIPSGVVASHNAVTAPKGGLIEWEGFTIEISMCRRPRVVCNVPTPFSLFTFNYCMKSGGRQIAHGANLDEFITHAFRAIKSTGYE